MTTRRCVVPLWAAWVMLALSSSALAQANRPATPAPVAVDGATPLSNERWHEHSVGLSLRPPLGSKLYERTSDDALVRIVGETEYVIKVSIRRSQDLIDVDRLARQAIEQVGFKQPDAVQLTDKGPTKVGDKTVRVVYFKIPNRLKGAGDNAKFVKGAANNWVLGQAFLEGDPMSFVLVEINTQLENFARDKAVFEAVLGSIRLEDPAKVAKRREESARKAEQWRKTLKIDRIRAAAPDEQWFRIMQDRRDVGWIHLTPRLEMRGMDQPGVQIDVEARLDDGDRSIRTSSQFFLSNDDQIELWSIKLHMFSPKLALAPPPPARNPKAKPEDREPKEPPAAVMAGDGGYLETGVRAGNLITITRQTPNNRDEVKFDKPTATKDGQPRPYVNQVEVQLLDYLIPRTAPLELGFYAYHPASGKIAFRTERVEPTPNGVRVFSRATPEGAEQVTHFDNRGPLLQRQLPDGKTIIPATRGEVMAKWPDLSAAKP